MWGDFSWVLWVMLAINQTCGGAGGHLRFIASNSKVQVWSWTWSWHPKFECPTCSLLVRIIGDIWVLISVCCCCCLVAQLCLTLCDPMDCSPPGSSVHGILQARTLEWVAISLSRLVSEVCVNGSFDGMSYNCWDLMLSLGRQGHNWVKL